MTLEIIAAGFVLVIGFYALFKFRKPINRIVDECDIAAKEWAREQEEGRRERNLERKLEEMCEFLDKDEYVPSEILFDRLRCHDKESRYFEIANDREKLEQAYMMEDLRIAMMLKERQEKVRNIISVIERTGEWPKTINEIDEIMMIELK